jgi:dihydroorotate dehydrogenase
MFRLPAETAHEFGLNSLRFASAISMGRKLLSLGSIDYQSLAIERFGLTFRNPVGVAAGFDKNGVAVRGLAALGFGFAEAGTVTNLAQPGNDRPRLFRLPKDQAIVNRLGFNNHGAAALASRLAGTRPKCVLGVNIGKSRVVSVKDAIADYLASFEKVFPVADYITVNVSSPNTPNLRDLQQPEILGALLGAIQDRNRELGAKSGRGPVPLLVKIAPDLSDAELESIAETALASGVSGIIATNTTTSREGLRSDPATVTACGAGGLSGLPLQKRATEVIARLYKLTEGKTTIIGVGGIFTAQDAWEKIGAGASLVQVYTGMIYEGPYIARRINRGLSDLLAKYGFETLDQAIGHRTNELI